MKLDMCFLSVRLQESDGIVILVPRCITNSDIEIRRSGIDQQANYIVTSGTGNGKNQGVIELRRAGIDHQTNHFDMCSTNGRFQQRIKIL